MIVSRELKYFNSQISRIKAQINQLDDDSIFSNEDKEILLPKYNDELLKMEERRDREKEKLRIFGEVPNRAPTRSSRERNPKRKF